MVGESVTGGPGLCSQGVALGDGEGSLRDSLRGGLFVGGSDQVMIESNDHFRYTYTGD